MTVLAFVQSDHQVPQHEPEKLDQRDRIGGPAQIREPVRGDRGRRQPRLLSGVEVELTLQAGVVTLGGHIGSVAQRDPALKPVGRTTCVRQVVQHLATA